MADWRDEVEPWVFESRIKVPYTWTAGETGSHYLLELKDNKRFLGTRCPKCNRVYHVPKRNCPDDFAECTEWVELGPLGTLRDFTIMRLAEPRMQPLEPPFAYGIIFLDGADTGFLHILYEYDEAELKEGLRVEPVFADERTGHILDVKYFRPAKGVS